MYFKEKTITMVEFSPTRHSMYRGKKHFLYNTVNLQHRDFIQANALRQLKESLYEHDKGKELDTRKNSAGITFVFLGGDPIYIMTMKYHPMLDPV